MTRETGTPSLDARFRGSLQCSNRSIFPTKPLTRCSPCEPLPIRLDLHFKSEIHLAGRPAAPNAQSLRQSSEITTTFAGPFGCAANHLMAVAC